MADKQGKTGFAEEAPGKYEAPPGGFHAASVAPRERVKLGDGGRFVIPASMRAELDIKPGDELIVHVEDGELRVRNWRDTIRRIQEKAAKLKAPGESVVDEFLAERREDQRRSDERFERLHREGISMKKGAS